MTKIHLGGDTTLDLEDAKVPWKYFVRKSHVWGTNSKAKDKKGPLTICVNERGILDMPNVLDARFYRTIVYVIFKNRPQVAVRYTPSGDGQKLAEINDTLGKKGLLDTLDRPVELWLEPPRFNRSLEFIRSPKMKEIRRVSAERRREKTEARPYRTPTSQGFRNGSGVGKAHMWQVR